MPGPGFRVGAPFAAEGAALEENAGSDAWPVVDAEFLDIENQALIRFHIYNIPILYERVKRMNFRK
jgi:hypothetical protein